MCRDVRVTLTWFAVTKHATSSAAAEPVKEMLQGADTDRAAYSKPGNQWHFGGEKRKKGGMEESVLASDFIS